MVFVLGCSRSKDTFTSRLYHQMVSRFNPLFNGEQALLQGVNTLDKNHKDNFDEILSVYRIGDKEAATAVIPAMDKAIEKATKVITRHSMMIRNDQKNRYIDNSYMLIGKARYYKHEYLEALETFNYVIQQFPRSKVLDEAKLWAAKTESALGNYLPAKDKYEAIYRSDEVSKRVKADIFASYAQLEIDQKNYQGSYQLLKQAVDKTRDNQQEVRWLFIMGQLQAKVGNGYEASELFRRVTKKGPPYELLFQAQLNRARYYDVDIQDPAKVYDDLNAMLKDDKNIDNRDQIYYVMAQVAERQGDEARMEEYLKKSIRASTTNATQKALSYLKLAETNFRNKLYPTAAAYYDSTATNLPKDHKNYAEVALKKESLAGLVKNLKIIEVQDSLQMMAGLSVKQRTAKIETKLEAQRRAEEASQAAEENNLNNFPTGDGSFAEQAQGAVQGGSWYFYNQSLRASGQRDFMNTFGNRKLEDNWRRKDKQNIATFNEPTDNGDDAEDGTETADAGEGEAEGDKLERYLKEIPTTEKALEASNQKIVEAYLAISNIYKNDLKDLDAAERQLKDLLQRYPDLAEKGRVWYTLYRINNLLDDQKDVAYYRELINQNLPGTEYAMLVNGETPSDGEANPLAVSYYKATYKSYNSGAFKQALSMADSGLTAYAETEQGPQFMLIKAFSLAKTGDKKRMEEVLNAVVARYSGTEQAKEAQRILDQVSTPKEDGAPVAARAGNEADSTAIGEDSQPAVQYKADDKGEHKYVAVVPNVKGLVNNVTIDITDFSAKYFKNINLNVKSVYISPEEQMVMVSGLPNDRKARQFFDVITQQKVLEKNLKPAEIKHFVISNSNFRTFYQEKDFEGYLKFFQENNK